MTKLIAVVAIATLVDGVRAVIQPGEEVTGLSALDAQDLKRAGAVQDADELAADEKTAAGAERKASQEYSKARKLELAKAAASGMALQP
jgi:hypothetical protein